MPFWQGVKKLLCKDMENKQILALVIHIIIPLTGLMIFLKIRRNILFDKVISPPIREIFILFATYGGLLMVTYTVLFWEWSGAASLGVFYLVFVAPIAMMIIANRQFKKRTISKYHKWSFNLSLLYLIIIPVIFIVLFSLDS
jgi:hypothetical protein